MDQSMVPNWSENMGVNPKDLQLHHMTSPGLPDARISPYDDSLCDVSPSFRYFPDFGNSHTDLLGLAGPNTVAQGEDVDPSFSSQHQLAEGCFPFNEASVASNGYSLQKLQQVTAYEDTTHRESQTTTSDPWSQQSFDTYPDRGMQLLTEPSMAILPQDNMQHQMSLHSSFASMSNIPNPSTSLDPKRTSKRPAAQTATARNRKLQMRRSPQRRLVSTTQKRNAQSMATPSQSLDAASSHTSPQSDSTKTSIIAPQEALALFEASIWPLSTSTQLELADLICQMKKLVLLDQQKRGTGSQSGSSGIIVTSATASTQDSISNSEMIDSESLTDHTSVSSTPRQPVKGTEDTEDSMSVDDVEASAKHEPCNRCGVKPLYSCTWKNCGYSTHSFADYKRHEAGDKHWPQDRYLCLQCIDHTTPTLSSGEPICKFCLIPLSLLGGNIRDHYVQCESARKVVTTFSRKDHLIKHLRKDHNMANTSTTIDAWKYGIDSKWPRQCGFCGIAFRSWDERMIHLKEEHFDKGAHISTWKLPFFPKSKDVRPSGSNLPRDSDDDDDEDGSPHGGNGGSWSKASGQQSFQNSALTSQPQNNSAGSHQHSRTESYTQRRQSEITDEPSQTSAQHQAVDSSNVGRPSLTLERYLNDIEEPVAARLTVGKSDVPNPQKGVIVEDGLVVLKDSYTLLLSKKRPNGHRRIFINNFSAAGGNTGLLLENKSPLTGTVSKSTYRRPKRNRVFCDWCFTHPGGFRGEHELRRHVDIEHKLKINPKAVSQSLSNQPSLKHTSLIPNSNTSSPVDQDYVYCELPAPATVAANPEDNNQRVSELDSTPCLQPKKEDCLYGLPSFTPTEIMAGHPAEAQKGGLVSSFTLGDMYPGTIQNFLKSSDWSSAPSKLAPAPGPLVPCSPIGRPCSNYGFPTPKVSSYPCSGSPMSPIHIPSFGNINSDIGEVGLSNSPYFSNPPMIGCVELNRVQVYPDQQEISIYDDMVMFEGALSQGPFDSYVEFDHYPTLVNPSLPKSSPPEAADSSSSFSLSQDPVLIPFPPAVNISILSREEKGMKSNVVSCVFQPDETKRRRRQESHNIVQRQRRDNINERISSLSKLVPEHCLEDEKIRKNLLVLPSSISSGGLESHKRVTSDGPEKCPIQSCPFHIEGFTCRDSKKRHTLTHYKGAMVCGFCTSSSSLPEKLFNRVDVFKRHLASVHEVEQTSLTSCSSSNSTNTLASNVGKNLIRYASDNSSKSSTCSGFFNTAKDFYDHLDDCILRLVRQEALAEALKSHQAKTFGSSESQQKQALTPLFDTGSRVDSVSSLWTTFSRIAQSAEEKEQVKASSWRDLPEVLLWSQHPHADRQREPWTSTGFQRLNPPFKETTVPPTVLQRGHSSNTAYPIRIPPEKQERARQLYRDYLAAGDAHSTSPRLSATLYNVNGKTVRTRTKNKISLQSKAKAALIRYLGSCSKCRDRRVLCPPEHHDIAALAIEYEYPHRPHASDLSLCFSTALEDGTNDPEPKSFIKPSGFRPNSLFVGREAELEQIQKVLLGKKRRDNGMPAVLVQAFPGGGKTHLSRQYVYGKKDEYLGDTFWLQPQPGRYTSPDHLLRLIDLEVNRRVLQPSQTIRYLNPWSNMPDTHGDNLDDLDSRKVVPEGTTATFERIQSQTTTSGNYESAQTLSIFYPTSRAQTCGDWNDRDRLKYNSQLVKPNIGHEGAASGISSLHKVLAMMQKKLVSTECHDNPRADKRSTRLDGIDECTTQESIDCSNIDNPRTLNMPPRGAFKSDPMQRMSLVTASEALEMAGYVPDRIQPANLDRIGNFCGKASDDWREINAAQDVDTYSIIRDVRDSKEPRRASIAIVGMACHLPGTSSSLEDFWGLLRSGPECASPLTSKFGKPDSYFAPPPLAKKSCSKTKFGNLLERGIKSDFGFFNINARDGSSLDPQGRLLLDCAYEALENAGMSKFGTPVGKTVALDSDLLDTIGNVKSKIHLSIDTACSSSYVALQMAYKALWRSNDPPSVLCSNVFYGNMDLAVLGTLRNNYDNQSQRLLRQHYQQISLPWSPTFSYDSPDCTKLVSDLAQALEFLHRQHQGEGKAPLCSHLDLKPQNILLQPDREGSGRLDDQWLLSDFGLSQTRIRAKQPMGLMLHRNSSNRYLLQQSLQKLDAWIHRGSDASTVNWLVFTLPTTEGNPSSILFRGTHFFSEFSSSPLIHLSNISHQSPHAGDGRSREDRPIFGRRDSSFKSEEEKDGAFALVSFFTIFPKPRGDRVCVPT